MPRRPPILLFDGECNLCNRSVRWVLRHEKNQAIYFASLQSPVAAALIGTDRAQNSNSVIYIRTDNTILERSDAVAAMLRDMGWTTCAVILRAVPRPLRNTVYRLIAQNRRQFQGKSQCEIPQPQQRERMLHELSDLSPMQ